MASEKALAVIVICATVRLQRRITESSKTDLTRNCARAIVDVARGELSSDSRR